MTRKFLLEEMATDLGQQFSFIPLGGALGLVHSGIMPQDEERGMMQVAPVCIRGGYSDDWPACAP